ncbi:MAG: histidine kinase dimerization/phospho-acceptor domain-containing protein [Acutalibacteraceae bacterium]
MQSIGEGNLYLQLEPKGSDELAQLTASVEQMRLSLLRKTSEEQRALQQNSDLITAMSHDIRNPLTALLGYLDLAKTGQYRTQEELQSYPDAAYGKAEQLKRLTRRAVPLLPAVRLQGAAAAAGAL